MKLKLYSWLGAFMAALLLVAAPAARAQNTTVTFSVNLAVKKSLNQFKAGDLIVVRGDFNGWGGNSDALTQSPDSADVYRLTKTLPDSLVGKTIHYKFVTVTSAGDGWEDDQSTPSKNREYTVPAGASKIPTAYFNNQRPGVNATANLTFVADMTVLRSSGEFNAANGDSIYVIGSLNGWSIEDASARQPYKLKPVLGKPNLYRTTLSYTGVVGETVNWKFRSRPYDSFTNDGWENGENKTFVFTGQDMTIDGGNTNGYLPAIRGSKLMTGDATVLFEVNVTGARPFNRTPSAPEYPTFNDISAVYLHGKIPGILDWGTWGDPDLTADQAQPSNTPKKMFDDGTHGDRVAGDKIFSVSLTFPAGVARSAGPFKFGIVAAGADTLYGRASNWMDNERGSGGDYLVVISPNGGNYRLTTPIVFGKSPTGEQAFNGVAVTDRPGAIAKTYRLEQNSPNPFNPSTTINFDVPQAGPVRLSVYNSLGQLVDVLADEQMTPGAKQVVFNGANLPSGVYLYRLQAGSFTSTRRMMLVK